MSRICLPKEIILKIIHYAHPVMNNEDQESIQITYIHRKINKLTKAWYLLNEVTWFEFIHLNTYEEERKVMKSLLKKCGCCSRHCPDITIVGDRTTKKRHEKEGLHQGYKIKKCNCWCRHHYRNMD